MSEHEGGLGGLGGLLDKAKGLVTPENIDKAKELATDERIDQAAAAIEKVTPDAVDSKVRMLAEKAKELND